MFQSIFSVWEINFQDYSKHTCFDHIVTFLTKWKVYNSGNISYIWDSVVMYSWYHFSGIFPCMTIFKCLLCHINQLANKCWSNFSLIVSLFICYIRTSGPWCWVQVSSLPRSLFSSNLVCKMPGFQVEGNEIPAFSSLV